MIRIRIGGQERDYDSADENWINQQINRRRADGLQVCVRVTIHVGDMDMILSTPTCGASTGGGRRARPSEQEVFDLWNQRGLDSADFSGGNLVAFMKQLRRLVYI